MKLIAKDWNRGYQIALFKNWNQYVAVFDCAEDCEAFAQANGHTIDWREYDRECGISNNEAKTFAVELFETIETTTEPVGFDECAKWMAKALKVARNDSEEFHKEAHELVENRMNEAVKHPDFDYLEVMTVVFWLFEDRGHFDSLINPQEELECLRHYLNL